MNPNSSFGSTMYVKDMLCNLSAQTHAYLKRTKTKLYVPGQLSYLAKYLRMDSTFHWCCAYFWQENSCFKNQPSGTHDR